MFDNGQFRAIIFDMDGLLVDSEPVWAIAEAGVLEARGKRYDPEVQKKLVGLGGNEFLPRMVALYDIDDTVDNLRADLLQRMAALIPEKVLPRPGAPELLAFLTRHEMPIAIASSSPLMIIDAMVANQGWDAIFDTRCSSDEVEKGKPAPDVYLLAAERLSTEPTHCLALEDSPNGARAAVAAGITCYAVPDPSHATPAAFEGITDQVFASLYAVLGNLQRG